MVTEHVKHGSSKLRHAVSIKNMWGFEDTVLKNGKYLINFITLIPF